MITTFLPFDLHLHRVSWPKFQNHDPVIGGVIGQMVNMTRVNALPVILPIPLKSVKYID